uniref:Uncharacterized protein n=1 Tax=Podoviridae sp. ctW0z17 TaxID=2825254 RepID=A0A8S5UXN4_9CAUD|nr:MAG TPA: hypothetical protein [Podoviridae sp. ctW0z17]DAN03992.1 MAG TPA: hypothetical protein [Caudoviricetes sp.]
MRSAFVSFLPPIISLSSHSLTLSSSALNKIISLTKSFSV